jgi:hypothetical protein
MACASTSLRPRAARSATRARFIAGCSARSRWARRRVVFVLFLFCGAFADVLAPYGMNQISPINGS